ncbi:hypothetical protein [Providencia alcalifaciens]|uniref:hypothetical protein n=1 Tax=Providencia alcalifaciens TaxID=126385 RepID=UPI001CC7F959|nr:hypothetical protein [Providencia alcalifaciens]CAG9415119.1 hypothetical protein NVI2019_GHJFPKLH_01216 [Providencia alcalifaciens]
MFKKLLLSLILSGTVVSGAMANSTCLPVTNQSLTKSGLPTPKNSTSFANYTEVTNSVFSAITKDMTSEERNDVVCTKDAFSYSIYMSNEQKIAKVCETKSGCDDLKTIFLVIANIDINDGTEAKLKAAMAKAGITEADIKDTPAKLEQFIGQHETQFTQHFGDLE